eukprot:scaffold100896_cov24-Prasinocladus_malaysianus.AAC.1
MLSKRATYAGHAGPPRPVPLQGGIIRPAAGRAFQRPVRGRPGPHQQLRAPDGGREPDPVQHQQPCGPGGTDQRPPGRGGHPGQAGALCQAGQARPGALSSSQQMVDQLKRLSRFQSLWISQSPSFYVTFNLISLNRNNDRATRPTPL